MICLSQAPEIYILTFIVRNNFAWRKQGISWLFFGDWERRASYAAMKNMITKHLTLPFLAFSLDGIVFPGEMQREDKTAVQIPWVGLPRRHKRALDLVAGLLWAVNRKSKGRFRAVTWPLGPCRHIALNTFSSSIFPRDKSNKTSPRHTHSLRQTESLRYRGREIQTDKQSLCDSLV